MKKILLLLTVLLSLNTFGQTTTQVKFKCTSSTYPSYTTTPTSYSVAMIGVTCIVETESFNVGSTYTISFDKTSSNNLIVTNGTNSYTTSTVGINTFTFSTSSITKDSLLFTSSFGQIVRDLYITTSPSVIGIKELNNLNIDFYSVSNSIIIKNEKNIENVKIDVFNLSGQLIYSDRVNSYKIDLNVTNGLYIVKLSKDNQYSIKKIYISN